jgi:hypothetical protein
MGCIDTEGININEFLSSTFHHMDPTAEVTEMLHEIVIQHVKDY